MAEAGAEYPREAEPTCPAKGLLVNKGISSKATKPSWGKTGFLQVGLSGLQLRANLYGCFISFPSARTLRSATDALCAGNH